MEEIKSITDGDTNSQTSHNVKNDFSYSLPKPKINKLDLMLNSPLLAKTSAFKTELSHTPLKSFTKLLERRSST